MTPLLLALLSTGALAQGAPSRQVPPSVLTEVRLLENRFEVALANDCDPRRCFSKGCAYVGHAVADRPRASSLPGLGDEAGPDVGTAQEYLTRATCAFAYEDSISARDVPALTGRLQAKLSGGWLVVSVEGEKLQPIPDYLQEPPPEPEPEEEVVEEPEPEPEPEVVEEPEPTWAQELWSALLPHFYWMIGLGLLTLAGILFIWAWRRVGQRSIEEEMLLAELGAGEPGEGEGEAAATSEEEVEDEEATAQAAETWRARLESLDPAQPEAELQTLMAALLRSGDLPLLAKAMLEFPEVLPAALPEGASYADAKLELAEYLKTADPADLPSDAAFYRALDRHALSATLGAQPDAQLLSSLRDEFGPSGLAGLIRTLPARAGALLFALASPADQRELVRLLEPERLGRMAEMLLYSNRMDPAETAGLFSVVDAARQGTPLPTLSPADVTDRGAPFDAASALSVLLEALHPQRRASAFTSALHHFQGSLPSWHRQVFFSDLLLSMDTEPRVDLMLAVDSEALASWLSLLDHEVRAGLLQGMPTALRNALRAADAPASAQRQHALARLGRQALARGFVSWLVRQGTPFEEVVAPQGGSST